MDESNDNKQVLNKQTNWSTLFIYQKSEVIYHSVSATGSYIYIKIEQETK